MKTNKFALLLFILILSLPFVIGVGQWGDTNYDSIRNGYITSQDGILVNGNYDNETSFIIHGKSNNGVDVQPMSVKINSSIFLFVSNSGFLQLLNGDTITQSVGISLDGGIIQEEMDVIGGENIGVNRNSNVARVYNEGYGFCIAYIINFNDDWNNELRVECFGGTHETPFHDEVATLQIDGEVQKGVSCGGINGADEEIVCYVNTYNGTTHALNIFHNTTYSINWTTPLVTKANFTRSGQIKPLVYDNDLDDIIDIYIKASDNNLVMLQDNNGTFDFNNHCGGSGVITLTDSETSGNCAVPIIWGNFDSNSETVEFAEWTSTGLRVYSGNCQISNYRTALSINLGDCTGFATCQGNPNEEIHMSLNQFPIEDSTIDDIVLWCEEDDEYSSLRGDSLDFTRTLDTTTPTFTTGYKNDDLFNEPFYHVDLDGDGNFTEIVTDIGIYRSTSSISFEQVFTPDNTVTFSKPMIPMDLTGDSKVEFVAYNISNLTIYTSDLVNDISQITSLAFNTGSPVCSGTTVKFTLRVEDENNDNVNVGVDCYGNGSIDWEQTFYSGSNDGILLQRECLYNHDQIGETFIPIFYTSDFPHAFMETSVRVSPLEYIVENENATYCFNENQGAQSFNNQTAFDIDRGAEPDRITSILVSLNMNSTVGRIGFVLILFGIVIFFMIKAKAPDIAYVIGVETVIVFSAYYEILPRFLLILVGIFIAVSFATIFIKASNGGGMVTQR